MTGNVGIGTASPTSTASAGPTLEISGTAGGNLVLSDSNATTGQRAKYLLSQGGLLYVGHSADNGTSPVNDLVINASGNVGIGTASPASLFHVKIATNENIRFNSGGSGDTRISAINDAGSATTQLSLQGDPLLFRTFGGAEMMRIDSSGNVGIGTSSPANKLHVKGTWTNGEGILQIDADSGTQYSGLTFQNNGTVNTYFYHDNTNNLTFLGSITGQPLVFASNTNGTSGEAMRIDSSGNLLVGTTSSVGNSGRFQAVRSDTGAIGYFEVDNGGGAQNAVDITNAANAAFVPLRFWVNGYGGSLVGSISCTTSATTYNTSSDQRLKENIVDAPAGNIDAIRVRSFDWKVDGSHQTYGMVAQELVDVAPEAVSQGATEDDMWQVDYSKLVPMMIKEIQDLKAEVAALKGV